MDYKKLGLKCGIEIHQQLEGKKLFCDCPTTLRDEQADFEIRRKLRAVAGEHGKVDVAAQQEQLKNKTFVYQGYYDTTCLVETDSEPPHEINKEALYTCLQLCKMIHAKVSPVIQVMRKTVVDGSNTSGFQRTALISRGGEVETTEGKVKIENVSLEEDACKIVSENEREKVYRLDRLGIPLIEIGTAPDIKTPEQCLETAKKIGMLLRSLPKIKRGLGTIRQDVNVSIKGGERIEVKGAQELKMLPTLVKLEAQRQIELLQIKEEIKNLKLNAFKLFDLTQSLKSSTSKIIVNTLKKQGKILGIKLNGFSGLIGRELQPNYRLGTELAGRAKVKAGVGGIFHSDELPNYGIKQEEVEIIKKELKCSGKDAFILVVDEEKKAQIALEAVYARVQELFIGIPKEVRKAQDDGTTRFMRPMPGASRMYPETDVPLIKPDFKDINIPELLEEKFSRYQEEYKLSKDLAEFIAKSEKALLFEELVKKHREIKPAFIAETLTSTLLEMKRKHNLEVERLNADHFRELFENLSNGKINKDIIGEVLKDMIAGKFSIANYQSISAGELEKEIKKIVAEHKNAPLGALMGICMKKFAGKASGKEISEVLRKFV